MPFMNPPKKIAFFVKILAILFRINWLSFMFAAAIIDIKGIFGL